MSLGWKRLGAQTRGLRGLTGSLSPLGYFMPELWQDQGFQRNLLRFLLASSVRGHEASLGMAIAFILFVEFCPHFRFC